MKKLPFPIPPETKPAAIIIRHAERDPIQTMINPFEALLTEKGKKDAYILGGHLAQMGPLRIYHSPVPRCRETAESIKNGISGSDDQPVQIQELFDLGGPYITGNWMEIADIITRTGHASFVREWFDGHFPPDLIMPLEQAGYNQLHILASQLVDNSFSSINITHDWNIMIIKEAFLNLRHEEVGEPDFLDGLMSFVKNNSLHLVYHEYETSLSLSNF